MYCHYLGAGIHSTLVVVMSNARRLYTRLAILGTLISPDELTSAKRDPHAFAFRVRDTFFPWRGAIGRHVQGLIKEVLVSVARLPYIEGN